MSISGRTNMIVHACKKQFPGNHFGRCCNTGRFVLLRLRLGLPTSVTYRVGQKSKLLILREYVNKTENIGGTIRTATEKMKHRLIFSREIFYVTIVLCLNIL